MDKKVEVNFFTNISGQPDVDSNCIYDDVDILQFLLPQLSNECMIDKVLRLVSLNQKITSLFECIEIFPINRNDEDFVLLSASMLEDENGIPEKEIKLNIFKRILQDWKLFLRNKKEIKKAY